MKVIRYLWAELNRQLDAEDARYIRELLASYEPFTATPPSGAGLN